MTLQLMWCQFCSSEQSIGTLSYMEDGVSLEGEICKTCLNSIPETDWLKV